MADRAFTPGTALNLEQIRAAEATRELPRNHWEEFAAELLLTR
jgi:hypothetical protein